MTKADDLGAWFAELPVSMQREAYIAAAEPAWRAIEAVLVIDHLTSRDCKVLGVEVWLATEPGPTMAGSYWEPCHSAPGPTGTVATNAAAQEFIRCFKLDPTDRRSVAHALRFNLTVEC